MRAADSAACRARFGDHLYIDNGEDVDFSQKKDEFSLKNDYFFYMICSTFLEHLYTENEENDDFSVKKHEFGMKNEWFLHIFFGPFTYR